LGEKKNTIRRILGMEGMMKRNKSLFLSIFILSFSSKGLESSLKING
jgi:hypothetical protein